MVISSTTPDFAPGQRLGSSEQVRLAADITVTVIADTGAVLTLRGPFEGPLTAEDGTAGDGDKLLNVVSALLAEGQDETALAAARGQIATADAWIAHAGRGGSYCASPAGTLKLQRWAETRSFDLTLVSAATGEYAALRWAGAKDRRDWPADVQLVSGSRYRWIADDPDEDAEFILWVVPRELVDPVRQAVWMAEHDCRGQARRLLTALR